MINPLFSIIVPVYNVEKYLKRCIDSIINQSYKNIELILVDDGSSDNSLMICQEYSSKDKRVRYLHKENGGQSSARNLGLSSVKGEWIMFVDADDYLISDKAIEIGLKYIEREDSYYCFTNNSNNELLNVTLGKSKQKEFIESILGWNVMKECENNNILAGVCGVIFNKKIIFDNNIHFDNNIFKGEDILFNIEYVFKIKKIVFIPLKMYYYQFNNESTMHSYNNKIIDNDIFFHRKLHDILRINNSELADVAVIRSPLSGLISFTYYISKSKLPFGEKCRLLNTIMQSDLYINALKNIKIVYGDFSLKHRLLLFFISRKMGSLVILVSSILG